jgi:hypothetical protein
MNREDFLDKYGEVYVEFSSYYKYSFTYGADISEGRLIVSFGGNADDIYRESVTAREPVTVKSLDINFGCVRKDGEEVCSFYEEGW